MSFFHKAKKEVEQKITNIFKKNKTQNISNVQYSSNSTTKRAINSACTLTLSTKTEQIKEKMDKNIEALVKKYIDKPEKLIQFLKMKGIKVYRLPEVEKFLLKLNEEEGFISPQKGIKAFVLNLVIGAMCENKVKISFKTDEMLLFNASTLEIYTLARALYKLKGFQNNLPGYDYKSQEIFKRIYSSKNKDVAIDNISFKDICSCKDALARDLESINFTIKLSKEYENSKKALQKLKETNSINV